MKSGDYFPYLEISLDNVLHNLAALRSRLPSGTGIMAVVKDCAYGCGSAIVARVLEKWGNVGFFAVNRPAEAFFLSRKDLRSPILVLGKASAADLRKGEKCGIVFSLNDLADIRLWKSSGAKIRFHCAIDTRMNRIGILPSEIVQLVQELRNAPSLSLEGAFTYFANADEPDTITVGQQVDAFKGALSLLRCSGISPGHIHYSNSAAIMRFDLPGCTLVRPGIALYGCRPDPRQQFSPDLKPIVALKSHVVKIKKVPANTPVSYGGTYVTERETLIATIALGYANGYPRSLSNRGEVLIRGRRYKIAGTVTMDYLMVDAGPLPAIAVGDEVTAIGYQGGECISPDDLALLDNTIGYEILCNLSPGLDRIYIHKGEVVGKENGKIY